MAEKKQQKIHTYKEYREKYGKKFDDGKLEFVSLKNANNLNKKKKYWKIEDKKPGYYEVSKKPWLIPVIILGSVVALAAAIVPAVLLTRPQPTPEYCDFKFTGSNCQIKVNGEYKKEHTFSLEKGKKPTEVYNIKADATFELPTEFIVPSIIKYTKVDESNATISFKDKINEDVVLEITATPIADRATLTVTGDGCKVVVDGEKKDTYTFTYTKGSKPTESISLVANNTYSFPDSQENLPDFLSYTKNDDDNAALSFINAINESKTVTIKAEEQASGYSFTFKGTDCDLNNETTYPADTSVSLTLTPKDATYDVPEHVAVKIDDVIQTEGEDYTYTPSDTSASLSLTVTGNVEVEALAHEKDLALSLKIKPTQADNMLGFVFQCTPKGDDPNPEVDKIIVNWGDNTSTSTISVPSCIDNDIMQTGGMFEYIGKGMGGDFPTTPDFQRHTYSDLSAMPEDGFLVKFYGDINNIAFGFPYPGDGTTVVPWGTANKHITSITTYCDLPAVSINSKAPGGYDFDTYVVFSSETEMKSIDFALGTTTIPNGCCSKARGLTEVVIPETVTKIGENAFLEAGLKEITIPDSVTSIGKYAFKAYGGSPAQLEDGVCFASNPQLEEIGEEAFQGCAFEEFTLPDSVTTVEAKAFRSDYLKTFNIGPNSKLESISSQMFSTPDAALERLSCIPESVTMIDSNAFDGCKKLVSLGDLSNAKFTSIGDYAFRDCDKLSSFDLPTTVTKIGMAAFEGCTSVPKMVITNAVDEIDFHAFYSWTSAQSIYFPDCTDEAAIIAKYGVTSNWAGEATLIPGESPSAI